MRNEELGINAFAPTGRAFLYGAVPTADGFCPFRVLVCVQKRDCEYTWIGLLEH